MSATPIFIHRAQHGKENPYFMMLRDTAQNREMTFEARGMLAYILSKPDDWKVQPIDLEQQCKKTVVYRVLKELETNRYLLRYKERNEKNQIVAWHYLIYESPYPENQEVDIVEGEKPLTENQEVAIGNDDKKPLPEKLEIGFPLTGKSDTTEYRVLQNKEKEQKTEDRIAIYIKAWLDGQTTQPVTNQYKNKTNRETAKAFHEKDIPTDKLTQYVKFLATDSYWKGKLIPMNYVGNNIAAWLALQPKEPTPTVAAPPPPAEREVPLTPEQAAERQAEYERIMAELTAKLISNPVRAA